MDTTQQPSTDAADNRTRQQLLVENGALKSELRTVQCQLNWFKQQLFGQKSEKRFVLYPNQLSFGIDVLGDAPEAEESEQDTEEVTITRKKGPKKRNDDCVTDKGLRFDDSVPVKTIRLDPEGIDGLSADQYEIIDIEKTYRLAQQPASSVVICFERPVIKHKDGGELMRAPALQNVIERSVLDVSYLGGMLVDKFEYHLPLYRQHLRLQHAGITLSRSTLTRNAHRAIELLRPIYEAQLQSVLASQTLAMDETPIKAGRSKEKPGKMQQGYFWPLYGDKDELCFPFASSRGQIVIEQLLGEHFSGTLLVDGYAAYTAWVNKCKNAVTLAQCWTHGRRQFVKARDGEEEAVDQVIEIIARLYKSEKTARENALEGEQLRVHRQTYAKPIVDEVFAWRQQQCERFDLLPSEPFSLALAYIGDREREMRVFLNDPTVALDTNHLERALRRIPMGRKNWNFCWTEIGAELVGIIQSLLSTCRLHDVDPYTYLVDVLQRVAIHPASRVEELTPRRWKEHFADKPLRSDLHDSS